MDLGRAIIDLCDIRGISQRELANKTGLSKTFHSLLENNHRAPSMETLNKLAKILDVPLYVIFYYATEDSDINPKVLDRYKWITCGYYNEKPRTEKIYKDKIKSLTKETLHAKPFLV